MFARGEAAAVVSADGALLGALLEVEAALARAWARDGAIPQEAADAIVAACRPGAFDADALGVEAARHAQPVVGLVAALCAAVGAPWAVHVHHGATSQDVMDTALMLLARRALGPLLADLRAAADSAARLAATHAGDPALGRTLLQPALATTFGLKAAAWMAGLDAAAAGLVRVRDEVLAVQLGGPVGASDAPAVVEALARELQLAAPVLAWHGDRRRPAELAGALGVAAGALGKVARDVSLLAQGEVAEVREGGAGGGSSSMAHKRNPVAAVSTLACAARVPGLVGSLLGFMVGEHERAAGAWQAEWEPLLELLALTGSAAAWGAELLDGLVVDVARLAGNLTAAGVPGAGKAAEDGARALVARALAARAGVRA
jgi:3-carboxy-cis,cis-muconate cycloisomerase